MIARGTAETVERRQEVIERLCALVEEVNERKFGWQIASDCFCGRVDATNAPWWDYQFEEQMLEFIETAVHKALDEESS